MSKSEITSIDEVQRQINRLCGIGDDVFLKYAQGLHGSDLGEQQRAQAVIDTFHKAGDMVFATYQNQPVKWSGIIDECQRKINALMGVSDEDFLKYGGSEAMPCKAGPSASSVIDDQQRMINKQCGVSDEDFIANQSTISSQKDPSIDDTQRKINELAGVDDETFNKYSGERR
ncbi:MAG: hypothetical protein Q8K00_13170 [Syntrophales bacterium]|nr:hypothetical protein [Syntrophales bacterium]